MEYFDRNQRHHKQNVQRLDCSLFRGNPVFYDDFGPYPSVSDNSISQSKNRCAGQCHGPPPQHNYVTRRRQRNRERSNLKVFAAVVLLFVFCWVLSAYRRFCEVFSLCSVGNEIVQISRILIFSNSAVNVVVYSLLKRDIRTELKRFLKCRVRQESLQFGLVTLRESMRPSRLLEIGVYTSMRAHQGPEPSLNQEPLCRKVVDWLYEIILLLTNVVKCRWL